MSTIRLQGAKEMATLLRRLPKRLTQRIFKKVLKAAAKPIVVSARSKAPVNQGVLKKSMGTSFEKARLFESTIRIGPRTGKGATNDGWYGHFFEFGTDPYTIKGDPLVIIDKGTTFTKSARIPGIKKQPFLRPAFEENAAAALKIMGKLLGPTIESVATKGI